MSDDVALLQGFEHLERSVLAHDLQVDTTIDNKIDAAALLVEIENHVIFLINEVLHVKLDLVQKPWFVLERLEIVHVLKHLLLELNPGIFV